MGEMIDLSEKYGIPFEDEDETYYPQTYYKWQPIYENDEDFWSEHGFTDEDPECIEAGWSIPAWKSSHC